MNPMQADRLRSKIYTLVDDIYDPESLKYILQTVYMVWNSSGDISPELDEEEDY